MCVRICAAIGDSRQVNISCGRYLYGFLRKLATRIAHGGDLMQDEMMIALVSADVQGTTESAWIWNESESGVAFNEGAIGSNSPTKDLHTNGQTSAVLTNEERNEWCGWENIQDIIRQMKREKEQRDYPQPPSMYGQVHPPLVWEPQMAPTTINGSNNNISGNSRISIANII